MNRVSSPSTEAAGRRGNAPGQAHNDWSDVSSPKPTPGLRARHARRCAYPERCDCTPAWEAFVFDKRTERKIRKTFATKTAAKLWRQDALVALRRGDLRAPREGERKVGAALDELVAGMRDGTALDRSGRRYRPSTVRNYQADVRSHLNPWLGELRVSELRRADIQRLIDRMHADGLAGSTIRNKIEPLRVLYRRAVQDEEVTVNPTAPTILWAVSRRASLCDQPVRRAQCRRQRNRGRPRGGTPKSNRVCGSGTLVVGRRHAPHRGRAQEPALLLSRIFEEAGVG